MFSNTFSTIASLATGSEVDARATLGPGRTLTVVQRSWPVGVSTDDVVSGRAPAESVSLSSDGRAWFGEWHNPKRHGKESLFAVYVERRTADGVEFHGWVDAVSRRIVQTG